MFLNALPIVGEWPRLLLTLGILIAAVAGQGGWHKQQKLTTRTLYNGEPDVMELFQGTMTENVARSSKAWVVQFYASWCGHCQRFQPVYLSFARDVKEWKAIVQLASVACSHPNNTDVCRVNGITSYPSLKYFPPNSAVDFMGLIYECPETVVGLRMCLVDFIQGVVHKPLWWPTLEPFRSLQDMDNYIYRMGYENKTKFIFCEESSEPKLERRANEYVGREVVLDISSHRQLFIGRMLSTDAVNYGVTSFPSLYRVNSDGSLTLVDESVTRQDFVRKLKSEYLGLEDPIEGEVRGDNSDGSNHNELDKPRTTVQAQLPTGVHLVDLESSLYFMFWREIAMKAEISGDAIDALKRFIDVLVQLLPVSEHVTNWLERVRGWLSHKKQISGKEWENVISNLQGYNAYIPERVIWRGCLGSSPLYRGYPCGLWTTFHTLTASAYNASSHGSKTDNKVTTKDVLLSIREFVRHFFGCEECREHFLQMATHIEVDVLTNEDGLLWLWNAHNKVNDRLHGDKTEDPRHPKQQFPVYSVCPKCHRVEPRSQYHRPKWNLPEVIGYLMSFYGPEHIIQDQIPYNFRGITNSYYAGASSMNKIVFSVPNLLCFLIMLVLCAGRL